MTLLICDELLKTDVEDGHIEYWLVCKQSESHVFQVFVKL